MTRPGATRRLFLGLLRRERRTLIPGFLAAVIASLATVGGSAFVGRALDAVLRRDSGALHTSVAVLSGLAIVLLVSDRQQLLLVRRAGERAIARVRLEAFGKLQELPLSFVQRHGEGRLLAQLTSDVEQLSRIVGGQLADLVAAATLLVSGVALLATTSPVAALPVLIVVPILWTGGTWYFTRAPARNRDAREAVATMVGHLQDSLENQMLLELSGRGAERASTWESQYSEPTRRMTAGTVRLDAGLSSSVGLARAFALALTVAVGALLVQHGAATAGEVTTVTLVLDSLITSASLVVGFTVELVAGAAAFGRLAELIEAPNDLPDPPDPVSLPARGDLEAHDISFSYRPEEPLFDGLSVGFRRAERVAIVGSSGSGKSTLAELLSRLRDPGGGRVTFGGIDLRDASSRAVRERIVVLSQDAYIFRGTLQQNVTIFRPDATVDEARDALESVGALKRLGPRLGDEVTNSALSDGERQLVSLARVALFDPAAVILDESTSHVDSALEQALEQAMRSLASDRIVIVIVHRLSTAMRADRIVVLERGTIVQDGPPATLLSEPGPFRDVARKQAPRGGDRR